MIALGGLSTLLVFLRLANPPGPNSFVSREIGVYLGFLLCLGITIGGFVGIRQRGMTTAEARDQARSVFSSRGKSRPAGEDDA